MQLCYYLLNKFSENHIKIDKQEWLSMTDKFINIKHRINKDDQLEVLASLDQQA